MDRNPPEKNNSGCLGNSDKGDAKGPNRNNTIGKEKQETPETSMLAQRAL